MWKYYALLSALFAALTAIFAKVGVRNINADLATAIRTSVILLLTWGIVPIRISIRRSERHPATGLAVPHPVGPCDGRLVAVLLQSLADGRRVTRRANRQIERRHHHRPVIPATERTGKPAGGARCIAHHRRELTHVNQMKLLIIEDEKELSGNIAAYMSSENYVCEQAFSYDAIRISIACMTMTACCST